MREILFRGKTFDNRWVEGLLVWIDHNDETALIREIGKAGVSYFDFLVEFETVGQYTGLTDKNGKKIFEGDIIKATDSVPEYNLMVVRNEGFGCFNDYYFGGEKHYTEQIRNADWYLRYKIIGNIHDNPELLEVAE